MWAETPYRQILIGFIVFLLFAVFGWLRRRFLCDPVTQFAADDPDHVAAVSQARDTLGTFWTALRSPKQPDDFFGLKAKFEVHGNYEHVWLSVDENAESSRAGVLMNQPQFLSFKEGDLLTFEHEQITDWMHRKMGKTEGGFTIRAMLKRLPPPKAKAMAELYGVEFNVAS